MQRNTGPAREYICHHRASHVHGMALGAGRAVSGSVDMARRAEVQRSRELQTAAKTYRDCREKCRETGRSIARASKLRGTFRYFKADRD